MPVTIPARRLARQSEDHGHVDRRAAPATPRGEGRGHRYLTSLLAPGGRLRFTRLTALRRTCRDNRWEELPVDDVWDVAYDRLLDTAHAIVVAELVRPAR